MTSKSHNISLPTPSPPITTAPGDVIKLCKLFGTVPRRYAQPHYYAAPNKEIERWHCCLKTRIKA